jgi:hypothetical protein
MNYKSVAGASAGEHSIFGRAAIRRAFASTVVGLTAFLSLLSIAQADQLLVTGANRDGSAVYDLGISPSSSNPSGATPIKPVFANSVTQINNAADEKTHSGFDALVWVPNPVCQSLDLIVADASNGQIVRYAGATTLANCNAPASSSSGTPIVNPVAQVLFKWSKRGSGPAQPTGISADAYGNLFVVSSSGSWDPAASVWVLPFNKTKNLYCAGTGNYCAPVLVDGKFCGTTTQQLSEVLVAGIPAVTSGKNTLWNAGDVLVLVGDSFDARLIAYAQAKLYSSKTKGLLNLAALPLSQPTSTPIPWSAFHGQSAAPAGMDIWPANPVWHTNTTMLFTTADGRILEFDTLLNKFVCNFAQNRGPGLQKIKVGSYASVSYAFVAQLEAHNTGQILVFGAAPTSGANNPIKTISSGIMNPQGLAVISSGSASLTAPKKGTTPCAPPNAPCVIAPLGPELVSTITAYPGDNLSGTVLEQNCIIGTDPRVTVGQGGWSCNGNALPIGAGTNYCPTFPAAVIPGSACGHSGPTGAGFAVIEGTATGIDPNDNNSFITTAGNIDAVLPGPNNLECTPAAFAATGQIPLIAWGPRSDLTTVEGIIPEDTLYGPYLGGEPGYLTELTGGCDTSTTGSRELSIFAIGLGLSYTDQTGVYTLQNEKYEALEKTVSTAAITGTVQSNLASDITTAEGYVNAAQGAAYPSTAFTNNINCALNEIAATDTYLRGHLPAFSSNLGTPPGGGNANPAGDIDGRLANWYTTLNTMLAGNAPYVSWPLPPSSVPGCVAAGPFTLSGTITGYALPSTGLVVVNRNSVDGGSVSIPDGGTTFSLPTQLVNGDSYGIDLTQPSGDQICTVVSGDTGIVNGATPPPVAITCSAASGPIIGDFGTVPLTAGGQGGQYYFSSGNTNPCVLTSLVYWYADGAVEIDGSNNAGYSLVGLPLPTAFPGYGTDTETLTCYQYTEGYTAAFSGPQIISNPGFITPTLAITNFSYDSNVLESDNKTPNPNYGNLSWTTSGSANGGVNTTCAIFSEFSGDGTPTTTPLAQNPVLSLPANSAPTYPSGLPYSTFSNPYPICRGVRAYGLYPDNMTLTCSDPAAGTAVRSLAVDLSAGCNSE